MPNYGVVSSVPAARSMLKRFEQAHWEPVFA